MTEPTPRAELLDIAKLRLRLRTFASERDWDQFHTPKNLAMAVAGEVGELLELFQWLTPEESTRVADDPGLFQAVNDELADVLIYLIRLADTLGADLQTAIEAKLVENTARYPVGKVRGRADKRGRLA